MHRLEREDRGEGEPDEPPGIEVPDLPVGFRFEIERVECPIYMGGIQYDRGE